MQTSYPLFEANQVLTSRHLNDLVDYLEQQDRLTRNKLIGIGIVCGLEISFEPGANQIRLTGGCAVTSEGYLLVQEESLLNRFRTYTLPVPQVQEASEELAAEPRYAFFFDADGNQLPLWELLQTDFVPAPGEPAPTAITNNFLKDKVGLLFLERTVESLRNCDTNDCADKGSEIQFTLRRLLIRQQDAQAILNQEQQLTAAPVHRNQHPRYDLKELRIPKINPAASGVGTFYELLQRIASIAAVSAPQIVQALKDGYTAYSYLLADMYPATSFPAGPFGDAEYLSNVASQFQKNIYLAQYAYDFMLDVAQSHNEFLRAAARFDAECSPNSLRFPRHVLLGRVVEQQAAFAIDFSPSGPAANYNPLQANTGFGPKVRPVQYRHHFIPSPALDRGNERLQEIRSLHYRTYLLALRYKADGLLNQELRITPSKTGDYGLSDKAAPFYYAFAPEDDLHRTWSFFKTTTGELERVYSHQFTNANDHPLQYRLEDHNFYRVEGVIGKGLGQAMAELLRQKRELGLSFAIEPVFIGLRVEADNLASDLDREAQLRAQQVLLKLLMCRMRDLDIMFLLIMAFLFYYLYALLLVLQRANTAAIAGVAGNNNGDGGLGERPIIGTILKPRTQVVVADRVLRQIRGLRYEKGQLSGELTKDLKPEESIAKLYATIREEEGTTRLFEEARAFARQLDPNANPDLVAQRIYPYLSLADATEELVEMVRAPSLAQFDFHTFQTRYDSFIRSFDSLRAIAEEPREDLTREQAVTNAALLRNYSAVLSTGPQAVVANLMTELQKRMQRVTGELMLEPYAQRHPGMEHRAGVPVGGTLILLYTHRDFIRQVVDANRGVIGKAVGAIRKNMVAGEPAAQDVAFEAVLAQAPAPQDPDRAALDDFVVLADFCVPYLCCDTDCSDVDLSGVATPVEPQPEPEPEPEPQPREPGTVIGTIFMLRAGGSVFTDAAVNVTEATTGKRVAVKTDAGKYAFKAAPGQYLIAVTGNADLADEQREVTVESGQRIVEDFVLKRRR